MNASVPSAHGHDARDRGVEPGRPDGGCPRSCRAGQICVPVEYLFIKDRFELETPKLRETVLKALAIERARRRHNGEPIAGPQRSGLEHRCLQIPCHLLGDRQVLPPTDARTENVRAGRRFPSRQEALLGAMVPGDGVFDASDRKFASFNRVDE